MGLDRTIQAGMANEKGVQITHRMRTLPEVVRDLGRVPGFMNSRIKYETGNAMECFRTQWHEVVFEAIRAFALDNLITER